MKSKERLVRSYCSEGLPRRWYSQESAESLVKRKAVIAVRDRKGTLLSIHFYGESRVPIKARLKAGTRYSYQELVGEGQRRWTHSRIPRPDDHQLARYASLPMLDYLRIYAALEGAAFRAVTDSVSIQPLPTSERRPAKSQAPMAA